MKPSVGQIRTISIKGGYRKVLLLNFCEEDGQWLCASISQNNYPIIDTELSLKRRDGSISDIVVQTWNIRDIDESIIENTEFITSVESSNIDDVLRLWSHPITGISVPDDILLRTGSPICNESDTRISYMKGELDVWEGV